MAAVAGTANLITGGNYMYLRAKPSQASLLDQMGPWPLYIATAAAARARPVRAAGAARAARQP